MKACRILLTIMMIIVAETGAALAQTPILSNIETPHPNLQSTVHIAGGTWGPGTVAYGPVGTPLTLTGSGLGAGGVVQFVAYKSGSVDSNAAIVDATVTLWTNNLLTLTVPSGALTGLIQVTTTQGTKSNPLPFMVTTGAYASSCPAGPSSSQLQITTASLSNGSVGTAYSVTLGSTGGNGTKTWSITNGSLPSGLSLSSSGVISGTPTVAAGPVDITFEVADSSNPPQTDQAVLSLTIESQTLNAANVYSYTANSYDGVGNLTGYTDSVMGTWTLSYDSLNRLSLGTETPAATSPNSSPESFCWTYDQFGNRTTQMVAESTSAGQLFTNAPGAANCQLGSGTLLSNDWASYATNNQITSEDARGVTATPVYDAAGNMTFDGQNYYFYDAESRVCAVQNYSIGGAPSAWGYLYDADGNRVAKGSVTPSPNPSSQPISCDPTVNGFQFTENYVLGPSGEELTMIDGSGNWQRTNVYVGGKLLATYDLVNSQPALHFHLTDPLGTRRMQLSGMLTNLGQPETDIQSLPFGDQLASYADQYAPANADDSTPLHFTGKERDAESGNDYFGARYYASAMGRFLSPDPLPWIAWQHGSRAEQQAFEAHIANPQALNMYAYVLNNPLSKTDPTGMNACGTNNDATCHVTVTLRDRTKVNGHYSDQFTGVKNQQNYNATATVSVNGKVVGTFLARTTPSDSSKFGTIANGTYSGTLTIHDHQYAIRLQPSWNLPSAMPNPAHGGAMYIQGVLVHQSGLGNFTGTYYVNGAEHGVSEGCQLICRSQYGSFMGATGISPPDGSARQRLFTVVIDTEENMSQ